ncbi:MAG: zinc ribbon domain-containing protein [Bacteroidota bacterium]
MEEVLQKLANLQYIDSRIDELKQLRGDLPEEVLDIETDITRYEVRLEQLEQETKDLETEKSAKELEIQTSLEKIGKYEEQQLEVRNNREYDALTKEIEAQKQLVEESRRRIEEIEKRQEEMGPEIETTEKRLEEVRDVHKEKKENLESVVESTQSEEDKLLEIREKLMDELDKRYKRSYNRLRDGLTNGIAVVAMEKGAALGMSLPPQVQVEVRRKNKIIIDENSGRIVVDPSFFKQAKEELKV